MSGARDALATLRSVGSRIAAVDAHYSAVDDARLALTFAGELVPVMEAVAALILALEAIQDAAKLAEAEGRAVLARTMAETGATTIRSETHTISVKDGARRVLVTDAALIPAELMAQPPPKPDLTEIGKRLRDGQAVPGCALSNGGDPTLQIRTRERKAA